MKNTLSILALFAGLHLQAQIFYIPTAVHVLYYDAQEDMTASEVNALINHVNIGLRGMSENNTVERIIFDTLWADTEIQLCLAAFDEFGQATDGIVHRQIDSPIAPGDFFRTKGESTPWNTDRFLNIWISSMGPGSESNGGIATTPTVPHQNFPNPYIGIMLNKDSYNHYQILIHEIGHYFGLDHLYFDDIADTPCSNNAINPEPACLPDFLTLNTCSGEAPFWGATDPPDMIENYMEYYGNCAKMFTKGQKTVMRDYATTYYSDMIGAQPPCALVPVADAQTNKPGAPRLFPNPTTDQVGIRKEGKFSFHLLNAQGQLLQHGNGETLFELNLAVYPKGFYFLMIEQNEERYIGKVIKQ
ncbi:MAG: zinc-dependent metalloprotease [Saprospiraceae bacterium]|nr:zinc-dependent metalloprotease [Saprospiraceae bacterium]